MNSYIKHIIEAFDFNSVKKLNKKINAVDTILHYIIPKINKREKLSLDDYDILTNCVGIYKVSEKDELKKLIKYSMKLFGKKCNLNWIDVSNITEMQDLFWKSAFNGDISKWNVSNVTNMASMFYKSVFTGDISQWDVSNVTTMFSMFANSKFDGDISLWNIMNVNNTDSMFFECPIKEEYKPKFKIQEAFDFDSVKKLDKKINAVDVVLQYIILKIGNREKLSLDDYDNILTNHVGIYKVSEREELLELIDYSMKYFGNECNLNWLDVSNVTDMSCMFYYSDFNGDISKWNVSNVKNMAFMFKNSQFNGDISMWNVSNVTDMSLMFYDSKFNGDISLWDVSNVKRINMHNMFNNSPLEKNRPKWYKT